MARNFVGGIRCAYCNASVERGANGLLYDLDGEGAHHYCEPRDYPRFVLCCCGRYKLVYLDGRETNIDGVSHSCQPKPNYTKSAKSIIPPTRTCDQVQGTSKQVKPHDNSKVSQPGNLDKVLF